MEFSQPRAPDASSDSWRKILLENALDAVIGIDASGKVIDWNRQAELVFGWNRGRAIGRDLSEMIIPPRYRSAHQQGMSHFSATGEGAILNQRIEITALRQNGTEFPVELTVVPLSQGGEQVFYSFIRDISEHRRIESELRKSRDQLQIIFENVADGILVQDRNFRCVYANDIGAQMCGFASASEFMHAEIPEVLKKFELRDEFGKAFDPACLPARRVFEGEPSADVTLRVRNLVTGREVWSVVTSRAILDGDGQPHLAVSIFRDVTEKRKTEYSRNFALDSAQMGDWDLDLQTGKIHRSLRYDQIFGYTMLDEGRTWEFFLSHVIDEDRLRLESELNAALGTEIAFNIECRIHRADGNLRWVAVKGRVEQNSKGEPTRVAGVVMDITDRKYVEEATLFLAEAGVILSSSLDYTETLQSIAKLAVPRLADWCMIDVIEKDGTPKTVAMANTDLDRNRVEELQRKYPPDWNAPTGAPNVIRTGKSEIYPFIPPAMLKAGATDEEHWRIIQSLKLQSAMIVPLYASGKTLGAITFISGNSGRRYGERDLQVGEDLGRRAGLAVQNSRLYAQSEAQADELRRAVLSRDEFLSIASHELKTPLTTLKLQTQMYQRRLAKNDPTFKDPDFLQKLLMGTNHQVDRLSKLVEDMLDISRIAHGKLRIQTEPMDLGKLVSDVIGRFDEQFKEADCTYQIKTEPGLLGNWDHYRLEQVIANLITNGLKYGAGSEIQIEARREKDSALIVVSDRGIGISPENLERIFQPFERAISAANISGLGLGLHITRQIVEAHRGSIRVESVLGEGTCFMVALPI